MQVINGTREMLHGNNELDNGNAHNRKAIAVRGWLPGVLLIVAVVAISVLGRSANPRAELDGLNQLAKAGDAGAELQLGLAYRDGRYGLNPDAKTGLYWLQQAATSGNAYAEDAVALAYAKGQGTEKNTELASQWWRKSIHDGYPEARVHMSEALIQAGHMHQAEQLLSKTSLGLQSQTSNIARAY